MNKKILYFSAPWCQSCKNLKPYIQNAKDAGVEVQEVDVEQDPDLAREYNVISLPVIYTLVDNEVTGRCDGFSQRTIERIDEFINQ